MSQETFNERYNENIKRVMFIMECSKKDADMYIDYKGNINYDNKGNMIKFIPKIDFQKLDTHKCCRCHICN